MRDDGVAPTTTTNYNKDMVAVSVLSSCVDDSILGTPIKNIFTTLLGLSRKTPAGQWRLLIYTRGVRVQTVN